MPACRLHVARGLTSHLILGGLTSHLIFGFGGPKLSSFQPPQTLTPSIYRGVLATKPTVSIDQPGQRLSSLPIELPILLACSPQHRKTNIPALALALGFPHSASTSHRAAQTTASHPTQTLHKFSHTKPHTLQSPPLPNTHRATPALNTRKTNTNPIHLPTFKHTSQTACLPACGIIALQAYPRLPSFTQQPKNK